MLENVSRETIGKINVYIDELLKWNTKINLISRSSTREGIWVNQVPDSFFLFELLAQNQGLIDIGSGGGFPAIILAILGMKNIQLVERSHKKTAFLRHVNSLLGLDCNIINADVRDVQKQKGIMAISSKAVCSVAELLRLAGHLLAEDTKVYLLKSELQQWELEQLKKEWEAKINLHNNPYNNSMVFEIYNICRK